MPILNPFDTHPAEYDAWFDAFPNVYRSELRAIEAVLPPPGNWVEVGVGTGRFASQLGIPVGIEPSQGMGALARDRGIDVIAGKAEALPLDVASVDALFLITVLCFVEDLDATFREVARVLRPGGHAIVAFIPRDSAIGRVHGCSGDEDRFFRRANLRSAREVSDGMKAAGLAIERTIQTLVGSPDQLNERIQEPSEGFGRGSFIVIRGLRARGA